MDVIYKLRNALRSIESARDYIHRAKREADDDLKRKLRNSENELEEAEREIKNAIRELDH